MAAVTICSDFGAQGSGLLQGQEHEINRWGNSRNSVRLYFLGLQNHRRWLTAAMKLKDAYSLEEKL